MVTLNVYNNRLSFTEGARQTVHPYTFDRYGTEFRITIENWSLPIIADLSDFVDGDNSDAPYTNVDSLINVLSQYSSVPGVISIDNEAKINFAIQRIFNLYGDRVSVTKESVGILQIGQTYQAQTTPSTIMELPSGQYNEVYVEDNLITHIASNNVNDVGDVCVIGMVKVGSDFVYTEQTVTLAGQTKTPLDTPIARCNDVFNETAVPFIGNVYVAEDVTFTGGVPQVAGSVHCMIRAGRDRSSKAAGTNASNQYLIISSIHCHYIEKAVGWANVWIETKEPGKTFIEGDNVSASSSTTQGPYPFDPYLIVPTNTDYRMVGEVDINNKRIGASVQGYIATVLNI